MFGGVFHDFLEQPWEQARGFLREELEQLQNVLASQLSKVFSTDGTLTGDAIDGDFSPATAGTVYLSNEGPHGKPKWAKVNVNAGVKNRLKLINFVSASASVLLGRRSGTSGDYEPITIGDGLSMSTTATLSAPGARYARTFMFMGS